MPALRVQIPQVVISRAAGDGDAAIYRSEVKKTTRHPTFERCTMSVQALCRGELDRAIHFELFDWEMTRASQRMGNASTTYKDIKAAADARQPLEIPITYKKSEKRAAKKAGILILENIKIEKTYSFLDFVNGGLEV